MNYKKTIKQKLVTTLILMCGLLSINITMAETMNTSKTKYNIEISMANNLKTFMGKTVTIQLKSGDKTEGLIKAVNKDLLHLERITGKEYYDRLILVSDISTMTVRYR